MITPSITAFAGRSPGVVVALVLGIGFTWLIPVWQHAISLRQWINCLLIVASFLMALFGLVRLGIPPTIVFATALAWLTWPVWLAASLPGSRTHLLVVLHPLFAINHAVDNLGIWTEQQGAYGLTNLGQDVQYQIPRSIWPAVLFHLGMTGTALTISTFIAPRSMNQIEMDASTIKKR